VVLEKEKAILAVSMRNEEVYHRVHKEEISYEKKIKKKTKYINHILHK